MATSRAPRSNPPRESRAPANTSSGSNAPSTSQGQGSSGVSQARGRTSKAAQSLPSTEESLENWHGHAYEVFAACFKHPSRLPKPPKYKKKGNQKRKPPKPTLDVKKHVNCVLLTWDMPLDPRYAEIQHYKVIGYEEGKAPISHQLWELIKNVRPLCLPMTTTVGGVEDGKTYHFAVRAVDVHQRIGPYSKPASIKYIATAEDAKAPVPQRPIFVKDNLK